MARGKFRVLSPLSVVKGRSHLHGAQTRPDRLSYRLTLIYAGLGSLWILLSDLGLTFLLAQVEQSGWTVAQAQTLKGWLYVLITAVSLYLILMHFSGRIAAKSVELGAMEEAFRDFAECASDWIWETSPDHRLKRLSERFGELSGLEPTAFLDRPFPDILTEHGVSSAENAAEIRRALEERRAFRDVICTLTQGDEGQRRYIRMSGKPVYGIDEAFAGFRGVGTDVTDEIATLRQRDQLVSVIEATPDLVGTADADGRLLYINRAGREMLGLDPDAPVSHFRIEAFHPPEADAFLNETAIPTAMREGSWTGRSAIIGADGTPLPVSQVIIAHGSEAGDITHLSTIARDLRDQLAAEERLHASQKMDALGQLTGGVAHDFNNLLLVILGNAERLVERCAEQPELRELATAILRAGERGGELTHRLLAFSRQQALAPRRIDPAETVTATGRFLERLLGADITLEIRTADDLWPVNADPGELETCLLNLVINARDAMPTGGTLTIEAANLVLEHPEPDAQQGRMEPAEYVAISVRDTGLGMTPDIRERVFEPFFTTKPAGEGSGLGLPMVYGFARQSGGYLELETTPGQGSSFRLLLPRVDDAEDASAVDEPERPLPAGHGEYVLVVEDDDLVRAYVADTLERLGYRVETAEDGPSALALLGGEEPPDLLLTDMVMPGGMTGREVADYARERVPGLRIIFTTGYTSGARRLRAAGDGADPVLFKPYRRDALARALRTALDSPAA